MFSLAKPPSLRQTCIWSSVVVSEQLCGVAADIVLQDISVSLVYTDDVGGVLEQMLSDNQNNMNVGIQGLLADYWIALPGEQHGWFEETELAQIDLYSFFFNR